MPFTQDQRTLSITSPLGADALILTGFTGREELSRPFRFTLDLVSENAAITPDQIVGKAVTWTVFPYEEQPRHFHGLVSRFGAGQMAQRGFRSYRAEVVPWLWFLTLTGDCRIFQNKTAVEIVTALFDEYGFTDYTNSTQGTYPKREYCVQYRESAFNFVSRLLEEEGIFYFFKHEDGKHTLMLADKKTAYPACDQATVPYYPGNTSDNMIGTWERRYEYRTGKWAHTDYNFETPTTSLLSNTNTLVSLPGISAYERYDYPGLHIVKADGDSRVKVRMEEVETGYDVAIGAGGVRFFSPGAKFTLENHDCDAENQDYAVVSVDHAATDPSVGGGGGAGGYSNTFSCIPASVTFRPARTSPRPVVGGPHTAVVVGPSGEEMYVDKYGRIKVQFHWDRKGTKDENSSCFVRVAQTIAGKGWGAFYHPRIGHEVVVEFLEGDPDRPLVTGCVYNATNMPPYELPTDMTKSGFKSRSTREGGTDDFNELYFEDKKDGELIYFHAQKDFTRIVENDDVTKVSNDQKITVTQNRTEVVEKGDDSHSVQEGKLTITVSKGDMGVEVSKGKLGVTVSEGNCTLDVSKGKLGVTVATGDCNLDVSQGAYVTKVGQGDRKATISMGNDKLSIAMGNQETKLDMGKSSTEAMQSIEFKVGQNSLKIDQTGITIQGMMVKIEGQVQAEFKGLIAKVSADAMLQMKGGVTMIG